MIMCWGAEAPLFFALLETLTNNIGEKKWTEYRQRDSYSRVVNSTA